MIMYQKFIDKLQSFHYNKTMKSNHCYHNPKNGITYNHSLKSQPNNSTIYHAESHPNIEVLLLLSGKVEFSINGELYQIEPGDFLIINSWSFHSSQIVPNSPCERLNLHFNPNFIPTLHDLDLSYPFSNTHLYQHIIPKAIVDKSRIKQIMKRIDSTCRQETKYKDAKIISLIQDLVIEINIAVDLLLTTEKHSFLSPKSSNQILQETIQFINANLNQQITASTLAFQLGISESSLYRIFKQQMGVSIHDYIQNQKMQLALSLIRKGHLPQNVSEMLGYDYYATFFTQFKRVFGKTPNQFK